MISIINLVVITTKVVKRFTHSFVQPILQMYVSSYYLFRNITLFCYYCVETDSSTIPNNFNSQKSVVELSYLVSNWYIFGNIGNF